MFAYFEYSRCPKCGHDAEGADTCPACGAVFSKIRTREIEEDAPHARAYAAPSSSDGPVPTSLLRPRWIIGAAAAIGVASWLLYSSYSSRDPLQLMAEHQKLISKALKTAGSGEPTKDQAGAFHRYIRECTDLRRKVLRLQVTKPAKDPLKDVRVTALLYANELLDLEFDSIMNDIALGQSPGSDRNLFGAVETVLQIVENPYSRADQAAAAQAVLQNSTPDAKVLDNLRATGQRLAERRRQVREQIALTVDGVQKAQALHSFDEMRHGSDAAKADAAK